MSQSSQPSEAVPLDQVADPGRALRAAYATGGLISLATSGTTAQPRRIIRSAASWVESFPYAAELAGLSGHSRAYVPGPRQASMNLYAAALVDHVGAALVDRPDDATHAFVTPAALAGLIDPGGPANPARSGTTGMTGRRRRVVVAGDRLSPAAADRAEAAGWRVSHYYGAAQLSFVAWGRDAESLRPFPEVNVRVRDDELWVRSPWVCLAEIAPSGQTAALRWADGWCGIGDRGRVTDDGRVLVDGRDDVLLCGGRTVYVGDVEAALRVDARGEVFVVPLPHEVLGTVPAAVCTDAEDVSALPAVARRLLSGADRPRRWLYCPAPPVTAQGKTDRVHLAAWAAGQRRLHS